jgi:hypothetical protein
MGGLRVLLKLHHDPHPWDDLWREIAVEHPLGDEWWEERSMIPFFDRIQIPAYLGCDWENVPLHLPGSLALIEALLAGNPDVRVALACERSTRRRATRAPRCCPAPRPPQCPSTSRSAIGSRSSLPATISRPDTGSARR